MAEEITLTRLAHRLRDRTDEIDLVLKKRGYVGMAQSFSILVKQVVEVLEQLDKPKRSS